MSFRPFVQIWIWISAFLMIAGWTLSAIGELNRVGYTVAFALFCSFVAAQWRNLGFSKAWVVLGVRKAFCRFRRPAPCLFLVLACLSLAAGFLYAPADGDSNAYRIPRVLHWLGAGQWHWISTLDIRMNISGCGFEWLSAPMILFTDSFRFIFLINWISFLMLPGLIYSVFVRLQVPRRAAWWWMWLLASGWCYSMQASSIINDSFATVYALASVDLALRAREGHKIPDIWNSLIAAGLVIGAKQTTIPLALVCAIAMLPSLNLLLARPLGSAIILIVLLVVSGVPLFCINKAHTGLWLGVPPNTGPQAMFWARCEPASPFWGIIGNAFCIPAQNLVPPIFPWAEQWHEMMKRFLQTSFGSHFDSFEDFGLLGRAVTSNNAGIGLAICGLVIVSVLAAHRVGNLSSPPRQDLFLHWLRWTPFLVLLVFMAKVGSHSNARQLASYYVFFFPALLAAGDQSWLTRQRWWQMLGLGVMSLTAILLIIAREHPLFPAQSIVVALKKTSINPALVSKMDRSFYYWNSTRMAVANPLKEKIPPDEHVVGYATIFGYCEPGLWMPLGSRKVERVLPQTTPADLGLKDIHYVVVGDELFARAKEKNIDAWLNDYHGQLIGQTNYYYGPAGPVRTLYLVRLP